MPFMFNIFAGIPPTTALSGTSFTHTALAPIKTLFPICMFPINLAPVAITTLFPIFGVPALSPPPFCTNSYSVPLPTLVPNGICMPNL